MTDASGKARDYDRATRLFRLGKVGPRRLVDDLVEQLARSDGRVEWFAGIVEPSLLGGPSVTSEDIVEGKVSKQLLGEIKVLSKRAFARDSDPKVRLAGLAQYFLVEAASRVHGFGSGSSLPKQEIESILADLAALTPPPFDEFFLQALTGDSPDVG